MYLYVRRALWSVCLAAVAFGLAQVATSEPQPRFAGAYELTSVVHDGPQVHFNLKFTLLNPGNADVKNGILVLMDSQPESLLIGEIGSIPSLSHLGQTSVTKSFTVPAAEYARWQEGHEPRFDFLVPASGGTIDVRVQARSVVEPVQKIN
jgi:hypothetical protein